MPEPATRSVTVRDAETSPGLARAHPGRDVNGYAADVLNVIIRE